MSYRGPPDDIYRMWKSDIDEFISRVQRAAMFVPMGCTSWWREYNYNLQIGGDMFSQHLIATAADLFPQSPYTLDDMEGVLRWAGLITVPYPSRGFIHTQLHPAGYLRRWALAA